MSRQLAQLVRLVDDLLDLSRITHNRLELRKAPVELGAVIDQAVEAARPLVESMRHELSVIPSRSPSTSTAMPRAWPRSSRTSSTTARSTRARAARSR